MVPLDENLVHIFEREKYSHGYTCIRGVFYFALSAKRLNFVCIVPKIHCPLSKIEVDYVFHPRGAVFYAFEDRK